MGESMRSTVRKAAKLAVYEEIMMSVKNHHMPATIRVETALEQQTTHRLASGQLAQIAENNWQRKRKQSERNELESTKRLLS